MLYDSQKLKTELEKATNHFVSELKQIRTGRASAEMIGNIYVEAYGGTNPLNTVGQVIIEDASNVKISVWDKSIIQSVEKSLREANLGGGVAIESDFIRIKFNPLTEEDRKARVKEINQLLEEGKVRIRRVRQEFIQQVEGMEKVSEDEQKRDAKTIQTEIDKAIQNLESLTKKKEEEILKL